jgi:hypothetical protein
MHRKLIIGRSSTCMVIRNSKLPAPDETISGGTLLMDPGEKNGDQVDKVQ